MSYLVIAQCMAAASFFTVAVVHLFVWLRVRIQRGHFLFATASAAAGANALAEAFMYQAASLDVMSAALRWYVTTSGVWAIAVAWFIVAYAHVGRLGRYIAVGISGVMGVALLINWFSPASFLYTEITSLREINLPWGEQMWLAVGENNPLRFITELALVAMIGVVADGCWRLWRANQRTRAVLFGVTVVGFMACFGTHAFFVDTGRLDSPYLSTFGFLALVALMSYDLAGEVLNSAKLSSVLKHKETQLRTAVADERSRIASDLHDSVTQTLFSTAAIADALPEVWRRRPDEAQRALENLTELTKGALAEMRTLLVELRPGALEGKSLGELLQQLADAAASRSRIEVNVEPDGAPKVPEDVKIGLYRVAQEGLNNIIKHAEANVATLRLHAADNSVMLSISDDGRGFEPDQVATEHLGLKIMRDRARAIGAELQINSTAAQGTQITVRWKAPARGADDG